MTHQTSTLSENAWWGKLPLESGETMLWEIGGIRFAIRRLQFEWMIAHGERPGGEQNEWQRSKTEVVPAEFEETWERFVFEQNYRPLRLVPTLANRPVVSRPYRPLTLLPEEEVRIYVSTPLWVRCETESKGEVLKEFPLLPLSDTWFGPSTREGELCYAARTHARLMLDRIPRYTHRATSTILLKNQERTSLLLERLNLPIIYLGLYHTVDGESWTQDIEVIREGEDDTVEMKVIPGPPSGLKDAKLIDEPREKPHSGLLVRAFSSLFG